MTGNTGSRCWEPARAMGPDWRLLGVPVAVDWTGTRTVNKHRNIGYKGGRQGCAPSCQVANFPLERHTSTRPAPVRSVDTRATCPI